MRRARRFAGLTLLAASTALVAACAGAQRTARADDSGPPIRGGTLKIIGGGDVDHLATTSAYLTSSLWLLRTFTRQLVTYAPAADFDTAASLVPDLAITLPSKGNGGISDDDRTYTFHLRRGVRWNTKPPREVTAHDAVRGMKLLCNPVNPTGAPGYYKPTILGMQEYCDAFARVPGTVEDIRRFIETHDIEGVRAADDFTVIFRLPKPTPDFLNLLAMPFASPAPAEYLEYLPDSPEFRRHTISNGPYQITKYTANREIQLGRNPAWDPSADPLRPAYVDRISLLLGMDQQLVQLQLEAGTADLSFDHQTPVAELATLLEIGDPNVTLTPPGDYFAAMDYLVINEVGPNNGGALQKLKVRQALEYAVDKIAVAQVWGGPRVARPLRQAVLNSVTGYRRDAGWYRTPEDRGDPATVRKLLAEAGYPNGLSLKLAYMLASSGPLVAQSVQSNLQRAGIEVQIIPYTVADFLSRLMTNPENARRGTWDIALTGWIPDWFGGNNGRSVLEPLFDGRNFGLNTMNYGGYNSPEVNVLTDRAITAPAAEDAEKAWTEAAGRIMDDAAIVPLVEYKFHFYHSGRTRNCSIDVWGLNCAPTSVWLKDAP